MEQTKSGRQQQQLVRRTKAGGKKTSLILLRPSQGHCGKWRFLLDLKLDSLQS